MQGSETVSIEDRPEQDGSSRWTIFWLIVLFPIWAICFVIYAVMELLETALGWIPIIGPLIAGISMLLMVPFFPIMFIYGTIKLDATKAKIIVDEDGLKIRSVPRPIRAPNVVVERQILWDDIESFYSVFSPPFFTHGMQLKNGERVRPNVASNWGLLVEEAKRRGLYDDKRREHD